MANCRGCIEFGNNCGVCEKCLNEKNRYWRKLIERLSVDAEVIFSNESLDPISVTDEKSLIDILKKQNL